MIKKLTITSLTALSLLLVTAQAGGMKCQAGKCGAKMMDKAKQSAKMDKNETIEKKEKVEEKGKEKIRVMKCAAGKCGGK